MSQLAPRSPPAEDHVWATILSEAEAASRCEPVLASYYHASILNHRSFEAAISFHLASKLGSAAVPAMTVREVILSAMEADPLIGNSMRADICAYHDRDPACDRYLMPFLYFKGFHAIQAHRVGHWLWKRGRQSLALYFQNQISQVFSVDIHPGATLGRGIMIDHATGVVIGQTAVVGDDVSMLHSVTLGGSGCVSGDRHPKIGRGVLISAGAKILGPISVGDGARVGAGSLVLQSVPAHATAVGVPAKIIGTPLVSSPALDMNHAID